jgi:hypothetical protein
MNPTLVDILILFSFVPVWFIIFDLYERWNNPRNRRRRQRNARYNKRMKYLRKQWRTIR